MDGDLIAAILLLVVVISVHNLQVSSLYDDRKYVRKTLGAQDIDENTGADMERISLDPSGPGGNIDTLPGAAPSASSGPVAIGAPAPTGSGSALPGAPSASAPTGSGCGTSAQALASVSSSVPPYETPTIQTITVSEIPDIPVPSTPASTALPPSTVAHLATAAPTIPGTLTPLFQNPKKGFVVGVSDPTCTGKINSLNCGWYYTWGPTPPSVAPANGTIPFTPMIWNIAKTANLGAVVAAIKITGTPGNYEPLLGYNEPDGTNIQAQGNMTVGDAVRNWPLLAGTGRILASPVMYGSLIHPPPSPNPNNVPPPVGVTGPVMVNIANQGMPANKVDLDPSIWLDNFLIQLSQTTNPVFPSIITVHWYGPPNAQSFLGYLDAIWDKYNLPIWVTEYSCADWKATCCNPQTQHTAGFDWSLPDDSNIGTNGTAQFMTQTVQGMMARHYVDRFSWKERFLLANPDGSSVSAAYPMTGPPDSTMAASNPDVMNQSALFASYLHKPTTVPPLTPLGKLYATF